MRASTLGFIFQTWNLVPVFSAVENVELPLLLAGVRTSEARQQATYTLERVGLGHRLEHRPNELSSPSLGPWPPTLAWCGPTSPPATSTPRRRSR
jgi:predicted ABC-type transport system involved in lysophospholipase L1 biosynthesis ATPase subunit